MDNAGTMMRYDAMKKSLLVAYLLWFFLGWAGGHRYYLRSALSGLAMLGLSLVGGFLAIVLIGYVFLFACWVWWLIDAFKIPGWVTEHNLRLAGALSPRA